MELNKNALLALDTIHQKTTRGIPSWLIHPMEHRIIDRLADVSEGIDRRIGRKRYAFQTGLG